MIWWLIGMYVLAGVTVGRLAWEDDKFVVLPPPDSLRRMVDPSFIRRGRTYEVAACWIVGMFWPVVPLLGLWNHVRTPR